MNFKQVDKLFGKIAFADIVGNEKVLLHAETAEECIQELISTGIANSLSRNSLSKIYDFIKFDGHYLIMEKTYDTV